MQELRITDEEEQKIGAEVSARLRARYGVVQSADVHRYVTLVGTVLAQASERPGLPWTFIVLDTDSVNAFAAPGGYVHVTRGALALIANEAELAGVLGHELTHITEKHTVRSLQKDSSIRMGAEEALSGNAALFEQVVGSALANIVNQSFSPGEEHESDAKGLTLANKVGYAPGGLAIFLTSLKERNQGTEGKKGLFPSHPETQQRIDRLAKQAAAATPAGTATLAARYRKVVTYTPTPLASIAVAESGAAGLAGGGEKTASTADKKEDPPKKRGFGLGKLMAAGGEEKKGTQASASGGSRGVDPDRDGRGGPNSAPVPAKVSPADLAQFKKEGSLA